MPDMPIQRRTGAPPDKTQTKKKHNVKKHGNEKNNKDGNAKTTHVTRPSAPEKD